MSNLRPACLLLVAGLLPLLALAQDPSLSPPPPEAEPPTEAELMIDEAMAKLRATERLKASFRQEVEMLGQAFVVEGQYSQQGPYTFSMDLQVVGLPQARGRMRQVSNGQTLWDVSQILDQTYYFRLELPELLKRVNEEPFDDFHRNYFLQQRLGLSGPLWLLDGLRQSARFDRMIEGEWEGRPTWIIRGNWKDMNALGLGPMARVPAYIPSVIEIQIDRQNGWPYQVRMLGKRTPEVRRDATPKVDPATGRPLGNVAAQEEPPSSFLLTYSDVEFEPEFGPGEFTFSVPENDRDRVRDRTPDLMAEVDQIARIIEAQKLQGGNAAAPTGSLLQDAIQIPPIGGESPTPAPVPGGPAPGGFPGPGN